MHAYTVFSQMPAKAARSWTEEGYCVTMSQDVSVYIPVLAAIKLHRQKATACNRLGYSETRSNDFGTK